MRAYIKAGSEWRVCASCGDLSEMAVLSRDGKTALCRGCADVQPNQDIAISLAAHRREHLRRDLNQLLLCGEESSILDFSRKLKVPSALVRPIIQELHQQGRVCRVGKYRYTHAVKSMVGRGWRKETILRRLKAKGVHRNEVYAALVEFGK